MIAGDEKKSKKNVVYKLIEGEYSSPKGMTKISELRSLLVT